MRKNRYVARKYEKATVNEVGLGHVGILFGRSVYARKGLVHSPLSLNYVTAKHRSDCLYLVSLSKFKVSENKRIALRLSITHTQRNKLEQVIT